jgi:O-antigen/teichoic acid export membrane protein
MRRDSSARLLADGFALATSLVTATLTAHALGPDGKGYYATVTLLATLFLVTFEVGIGDALVVLVGLGKARLHDAAGATMQATLWLALSGTIAFLVTSALLFAPVDGGDAVVLALAGALVAVGVWYSTLVSLLLSVQCIVILAVVSAIGSALTAAVMVVLAIGFELNVQGAMAASLCGASAAAVVAVLNARASGIALTPRHVPGYLPRATRLGVGFQLPNLLVVAAARLDLLLVFKLSGAAAAGRYSVALTIGALVVSIPTAVAYAAFPRVSKMSEMQARAFVSRVFRNGMAGALLTALLLAAATPIALPWVFGERFGTAVTPTLILLLSAVPWSGQWLLARCASARGATAMLAWSFGIGFVVMIGLDVILIPTHGETGAASAALASSSVGLLVVAVMHLRARRPLRTPAA